MVYGAFTDPATGRNFIVVRMPDGRTPWVKKIAPAIARLVRPWMGERNPEGWCGWGVDGELGGALWVLTSRPSRYDWKNDTLQPCPYGDCQ